MEDEVETTDEGKREHENKQAHRNAPSQRPTDALRRLVDEIAGAASDHCDPFFPLVLLSDFCSRTYTTV